MYRSIHVRFITFLTRRLVVLGRGSGNVQKMQQGAESRKKAVENRDQLRTSTRSGNARVDLAEGGKKKKETSVPDRL